MRIEDELVKMLNEESWDDVNLNYLDSSSTTILKHFFCCIKKCMLIYYIHIIHL
jgi:hypothetical protein